MNPDLTLRPQQRHRLRRIRRDRIAAQLVRLGGIAVVGALLMIIAFLVMQSLPLQRAASVTTITQPERSPEPLLGLALAPHGELLIEYRADGSLAHRNSLDGALLSLHRLDLPAQRRISSFARDPLAEALAVFGLDDGSVRVLRSRWLQHWPAPGQREIRSETLAPQHGETLQLAGSGRPLLRLAVHDQGGSGLIAGQDELGGIWLARFGTETTPNHAAQALAEAAIPLHSLVFAADGRALIGVCSAGRVRVWDLRGSTPDLVEPMPFAPDSAISALAVLDGGRSLIAGFADGRLQQWLLQEGAEGSWQLQAVRGFRQHPAAIAAIEPERGRRGFVAIDAGGGLGLHHASSGRTLWLARHADRALHHVALSVERSRMLTADALGQLTLSAVDNPHPEVSLAALWKPVHYEGRDGPDLVWQSSSASDQFEPKFSLVPLTVGTLKAALFAMLFAVPLALAAAIYTAFFLAPRLRAAVKPAIELMEALPTVVMGFLAGLWLAPWVEAQLMVLLLLLVGLPLAVLLLASLFMALPIALRRALPAGSELLLLIPLLVLLLAVCLLLAPALEQALFGSTLRQWLAELGVGYEQRNALVVGIAMGVAVVPTVFSIAEDAVFSVPRQLAQGALALGATSWQAMLTVVLPTASPGLFSAVMIGFGRATGETMIVLMATGNSPVVNFNPFEGMRTLSATLAVELPEAAAASTHFRVLFLAGLLLLAISFVFNSLAEAVRQGLRRRYANL